MLLRYEKLSAHPTLFQKLTGLRLGEFSLLVLDVRPLLEEQRNQRLNRPNRVRTIGGGEQPTLEARDQILMTIVWLRIYPTNELLGYLFGVSEKAASRVISMVLPVLAKSGNDTMRKADPGRKHRLDLPQMLKQLPELNLIVDSFEQKVQYSVAKPEGKLIFFTVARKSSTLSKAKSP